MPNWSNYVRVAVAALVALAAADQARGAFSYTTDVSLPLTATDPASGLSTTYTTLAVPSGYASDLPNGTYLGNNSIVVGTVSGYNSKGTSASSNVTSAFAYDPINGFRLIGNYTTNANGLHVSTSVRAANTAGQVLGNSGVYDPTSAYGSTSYGQNAWLYTTNGSTVNVGLSGANFSYPVAANATNGTAAGTYSFNQGDLLNNSGQAVGYTTRYQGSGTSASQSLGQSVWMYSGGTTNEVGLFGTGYSYVTATGRYSSNSDVGLNSRGQVVGTAKAYTDRGDGTGAYGGTDGWIYTPATGSAAATTTPIGLYNSGMSVTGTGLSSPAYSVNVTQGSGTSAVVVPFRNTAITTVSNGGYVAGTSNYYNGTSSSSVGTDAFVYNANSGKYAQVGLTTNSYVAGGGSQVTSYVNGTGGARNSAVAFVNDVGQSAGTSTRYNVSATGSQLGSGTDAWTADGNGNTTRIGLYDSVHTVTVAGSYSGLAKDAVTNLTLTGYVAGTALRYKSTDVYSSTLGQDAWVYDPTTQLSTILGIAPTDTTDYEYTQVQYLADDGEAAGSYRLSGSSASAPLYAFVWSPTGGFVDLGTAVSPSLSAAGYASLITAYFDGSGTALATANSTSGGAATAIVSVAVPEPASAAVLLLGAVGLLSRRRRRTV